MTNSGYMIVSVALIMCATILGTVALVMGANLVEIIALVSPIAGGATTVIGRGADTTPTSNHEEA